MLFLLQPTSNPSTKVHICVRKNPLCLKSIQLIINIAWTYLQPNYGNVVSGNVYL